MRIVLLLTLTSALPAHAARCGPSRVPKGEVCCNSSCGTSIDPAPNNACVALHCGWDRHQAGGYVGVMPSRWLQPFSSPEVDGVLLAGTRGEPVAGMATARIPLSTTWILRAEISRRGALLPPGRREQHLLGEVIYNVPLGTTNTQAALHVAAGAAQSDDILDAVTPYDAFAAREVGGVWRPRAHVGTSFVRGRSIWGLSGSARMILQSTDDGAQLGYHGGIGSGMHMGWMNVAAQVGVEVSREPTDDHVYVGIPAGVYWTGIDSRVLLGVESRAGGTPSERTGLGWQVGLRLRVHGNGRDMRDLRQMLQR